MEQGTDKTWRKSGFQKNFENFRSENSRYVPLKKGFKPLGSYCIKKSSYSESLDFLH